MAALSICRNLVVIQSGGSLLTYIIGSTEPPSAVKIQKPEKKDSEKKDAQHTGTEEGRDDVLAFGLSPSGWYLVGCDDYKQLWVWTREPEREASQWTLLSKRVLPRRSSSLTFTSDERSVIVADKSGDAYSYSLTDTQETEGTLLAGHISMLLDVLLCGADDNLLVTCDRDEKIRVSHHPNAYNIQSYCLGHTEFVSKLGYFEKEDVLISGGGDGTLRMWNYMKGEELFQLDLKEEFTSCDQAQANQKTESGEVMDTSSPDQTSTDENTTKVKATPLARTESVADVKCLECCQKNNYMAVSCYRQNAILFYKLSSDQSGDRPPQFVKKQKLLLSGSDVWSLKFDQHCNLWCLQSDRQQITQVFAYVAERDEYVPLDSNHSEDFQAYSRIVSDLNTNQQEFFKAAFVQPINITPLHKVKIDNVTEYQERKQKKMAEKLSKRKGPTGAHCDSEEKKTKT